MRSSIAPAGLIAILTLAGCRPEGTLPPAAATVAVVDSTIPRDESLRRFRIGIDSVAELSDGATTRDELVKRFVAALEQADTAGLRRLAITRAEFGWIYYPTTPQGLPPYDLAPALLWFMTETRGRTGISRALQARGGRPLGYHGHRCDDTPSVEGENLVWGPCVITRRQERGDEIEERLFGPILERHGRFKFVSYANKLD